MIPAGVSPILDHLWQSTVFAAVIGGFVFSLRKVQARFRYALWLAASVKFLVPFAFAVAVGSRIHWPSAQAAVHTQWSVAMTQASQPFAERITSIGAPIANSHLVGSFWTAALALAWACGFVVVIGLWFKRWCRIRAMVRAATPLSTKAPIRVLSSAALLEPSVFGIIRPVLLLPKGIETRLTAAQLNAVYMHELCHVRRRDNLAAALHMLVEALFWFHPLVWWLEARLIEERERACDEAVLQAGNHPQDYAESILEVCKLCLASPLACASGVSGADLKKRIETIMNCRIGRRLNALNKVLLVGVGGLALVVPVAIGLLNPARAQEQPAQTFEVASIKPSDPAKRNIMIRFSPNFTAEGVTARALIDESYQVHDFQIEGLPKWADSARYDIDAKGESSDSSAKVQLGKMSDEKMNSVERLNQSRIKALLADRFQLKLHTASREMPVYEMVVAKGGVKFQKSGPANANEHRGLWMRPGELTGTDAEMKLLSKLISQATSRVVIDKTGLTGRYDFTLHYTPDRRMGPPPGADGGPGPGPEMKVPDSDTNGPTLVTALQEQLGLKLQPAKGPVDILVVDHIEKPSPN